MKKAIILFLCLVVMGTGLFALDKAAGFGLLYNYSTTLGSFTDYDGLNEWKLTRNGFGFFGFFGFNQYTELNLGLLYKNPDTVSLTYGGNTYKESASDWLESTLALQLGLYFKWPIPLGSRFVLFPTLGADFEFTLGGSSDEYWTWWHDLWLRGGLGMDIFLTDSMFLRGHLIYGAALPLGGDSEVGLDFSHGLLVKFGLGWMF